jgi:hypothetical protein
MKTATSVVLMATAGLLIVCGVKNPPATPGGSVSASAQTPTPDAQPTGGDKSDIPQDRTVVITVAREKGPDGKEYEKLSAKPRFAIIRKGRPLTFKVDGLRQGMHIEIDFEVYEATKGPFPPTKDSFRGRYLLDNRKPEVTTDNSNKAGYFKYHVVLREGTRDVFALDPGVVVKNEI